MECVGVFPKFLNRNSFPICSNYNVSLMDCNVRCFYYFRALEKKVKRLMAERGDYKGWYYVPYGNERHIYVSREKTDAEMARKGFGGWLPSHTRSVVTLCFFGTLKGRWLWSVVFNMWHVWPNKTLLYRLNHHTQLWTILWQVTSALTNENKNAKLNVC